MTSADLPVLTPGTPLDIAPHHASAPRTAPTGGRWHDRLASPVVGPTVLVTAIDAC